MIQAAIFDLDGTLLDSIPIWNVAGARYLKTLGAQAEPDLHKKIAHMSISEAAFYMKEHYQLTVSAEEIVTGVIGTVRDFYYYEAPLKRGVKEYLQKLSEQGIPMVIATTSDRSYLEAALTRTGVKHYFSRIFTCAEVGAGKTDPLIYQKAAEYLGTTPENTYVFEDAIHAIKTAKNAGFTVVGVYDAESEKHTAEIQALCDIYIQDFTCATGTVPIGAGTDTIDIFDIK